jgi:hypothetical protein
MNPRGVLVVCAVVVLASGCDVKRLSRELVPTDRVASIDHRAPYLKAHLRDGRVLVLSGWNADTLARSVKGTGRMLGVNRDVIAEGELAVALDSVALFETNVVHTAPAVGALAVLTGASLALSAYCAANPKSCFGSCPTFYAFDGSGPRLQAEGFSASVLPALEATDVDALWRVPPPRGDFVVRMTNEAYETHVVRHVHLLAVPHAAGERAFAVPGDRFERGRLLGPPARCVGPEGDCTSALRAFDGIERSSLADSTDLAARETLELEWTNPGEGTFGLVLARRQTLLSTYLFYQALAYMGRSAGDMLATLERGGRRSGGWAPALGGIEVFVEDGRGGWMRAGEDGETGPLASDVRMVPLPRVPGTPLRIRLRLTRGLWRLDWVALARRTGSVEPVRIKAYALTRADGAPVAAIDAQLVTFPGDEYDFRFAVPPGPHELFLESRGYYLEWMRDEWLAEEDPVGAVLMLARPEDALRRLAPGFKAQESGMERAFWSSRYARP